MKYMKIYATTLATVLVLSTFLMAMPAVFAGKDLNGNGAPNGPHWNLNLIGVKDKNFVVDPSGGHRIFVKLWGQSFIWLTAGPEFQVTDADGTDRGGANLTLVDPYPGETNTAVYRIYIRALGKPGMLANMSTGFVDELGNYWYSVENVTLTHTKGGAVKFSDKTLELTTILLPNGTRLNLFDNALYQYFWSYDNYGQRLVQLRFYMVTE